MGNLLEFFNKEYTLKIEVLLNGGKQNKVCFSIINLKNPKLKTQHYLDFADIFMLAEDMKNGLFFNPKFYLNGFQDIKSSGLGYRDFKISKFKESWQISMLNRLEQPTSFRKIHIFNLSQFDLRKIFVYVQSYIKDYQIAYRLASYLKK